MHILADSLPTPQHRPAIPIGAPIGALGRILVVGDGGAECQAMANDLRTGGYRIRTALTEADAAASGHDLVLLHDSPRDVTGLDKLQRLTAAAAAPVVIVSGRASVGHAVEAMRRGAFDYIAEPVAARRLTELVTRAVALARVEREVMPAPLAGGCTAAILGHSTAIVALRALIERLACRGDSTVLVTGESGTGKDLVARAVHAGSPRSRHAFVNVTCTALPSNLLESELFGHERGAFTDAKARHIGLLEQARGGTLFLDEIGDMEVVLQSKLLRVLEEKRFRRVGGTVDMEADVRIVAATHADLEARVSAGTFRQDLYYRLAVLPVHVPTLRDRREDVPELAHAFLQGHAKAAPERPGLELSAAALRKLERYDWPGNVRQLRNTIERAAVLTDTRSIGCEDIQVGGAAPPANPYELPAGGVDLAALEREFVVQALERSGGNATAAARMLGMNRDQIRYRVHKYRLGEAGD